MYIRKIDEKSNRENCEKKNTQSRDFYHRDIKLSNTRTFAQMGKILRTSPSH